MDLIENDLIQRIKDGEQNSILLLFRMYYAPLYTYAAGLLKSKESAEEVVQDTFIKIEKVLKRLPYQLRQPLFQSIN